MGVRLRAKQTEPVFSQSLSCKFCWDWDITVSECDENPFLKGLTFQLEEADKNRISNSHSAECGGPLTDGACFPRSPVEGDYPADSIAPCLCSILPVSAKLQ